MLSLCVGCGAACQTLHDICLSSLDTGQCRCQGCMLPPNSVLTTLLTICRAAFSVPQLKGKAAIDVICNPLGKSGGALIQQVMIVSFGSLAASTPYLGGILLVIVLIWLKSARSLDKQFTGARPDWHPISRLVDHGKPPAQACMQQPGSHASRVSPIKSILVKRFRSKLRRNEMRSC